MARPARLPPGLGTNLNCLGLPDEVIQKILRHAHVSTMQAFYVKPASADVQNAMKKLEQFGH